MFDVTWVWTYPPIPAKEATTEYSTYEDDVFWEMVIVRSVDEEHEVGIKQKVSNRFINQRGIWFILNHIIPMIQNAFEENERRNSQ